MAKEKKAKKEKQPGEYRPLKSYFTQKTFLVVTLAGFVVLAAVYMFIYSDYTLKTEQLASKNNELRNAVNELEEYNANMEQYKVEIEEIKKEAEKLLDAYPADVREEDAIMLAVNLGKRNIIDFDAINMEEKETVYTVEPYLVQAAAMEGLDESLVFAKKHAVYVNELTYDELKSVIKQVYDSDNRIGIDNIVYTKDEEYGILKGNIDIYFYSLAGTDKEYKAPDIAPYKAGTKDPFKSKEVIKKMVDEIVGEILEDGATGNGAKANANADV